MPREHSDLFKACVIKQNDSQRFVLNWKSLEWELAVNEYSNMDTLYSALDDLLREVNDAQYGIVSTKQTKTENGKTEIQWVRDATAAVSIDAKDRMSPNDPLIEANNALLRMLSRLRPICYAIGTNNKDMNMNMNIEFATLAEEILTTAQNEKSASQKLESIKNIEKGFNTYLLEQLHAANLTTEIYTEEDAKKLLFHYRNMSSLLEPARTVVTYTYEETKGALVREIQYPVTEKTEDQKKCLEQLKSEIPYPSKSEMSAHSKLKLALQKVDTLFADKMLADDTMLPAQTRKTNLVGVKNAYIGETSVVFLGGSGLNDDPNAIFNQKYEKNKTKSFWYARTGSPVYVGKGEKDDSVQLHTEENLKQIIMAANKRRGITEGEPGLKIHFTSLNTDSILNLENQNIIIGNLKKALLKENTSGSFSNVPTNFEGKWFHSSNISSQFSASPDKTTLSTNRFDEASNLALKVAENDNFISTIGCASGQDRTGTAVVLAQTKWLTQQFDAFDSKPPAPQGESEELINSDETKIQLTNKERASNLLATGGNAAEIATELVHGSPGMKSESDPGIFSKNVSSTYYRKSANTNKEPKLAGELGFLNQCRQKAREELKATINQLETTITMPDNPLLSEPAKNLIAHIKTALDTPNLTAKEFDELKQIVICTQNTIADIKDSTKTNKNIERLANILTNIRDNTYTPWRNRVFNAMVVFFAAALVASIVTMMTIPTFGFGFIPLIAGMCLSGVLYSLYRSIDAIDTEKRVSETLGNTSLFKEAVKEHNNKAVSTETDESHPLDNNRPSG